MTTLRIPSGYSKRRGSRGEKCDYVYFACQKDGTTKMKSIAKKNKPLTKIMVKNCEKFFELFRKMNDINFEIFDVVNSLEKSGEKVSRKQLGQYYKPPGEVFPLKGPKLFRDGTVSDIGALLKQLKRLAKMSDGELKRWATKYLKEIEQMSKPEVNRVTQKTNYVKVGLHPEQRKFGKRPEDQGRIFAELKSNIKKDAESFDVEVVAIENTKAQNRALFAIQTLLDEKNYKGNLPSNKIRSYAFKKKIELPIIKFTPAQYLKAYGVKKYKSARGKSEFCCNEREIAKQALLDLASKRFLLIYERKYYVEVNKRRIEEQFDIIRTVSPLIKIIEGYKALK